jgi:segregation and condensation protein B
MDQTLINRIVEAALLASNQPLSLAQLRELFPEEQPAPNGAVEAAIAQLQVDCAERGVELVEVASGFRYQVKADVHAWVARLWTERQTRYTRATLETLALIAYRQPITRGEIEQVRGVTVSSNIIKALEEREWIRVVGHRDVPGRPALFGTTKTFLDYFGLKRLDELPPLSELKDIGELEPQLQFDAAAGVDARIAAGVADGAASGEAADTAPVASGSEPDGGALRGDREPGAAERPNARDDRSGEGDRADDADVDADSAGAADDADGDLDFRTERPIVFEDDGDDGEQDPGDAYRGVESRADTNDADAADGDVTPEAAPGTRAATENETGSESFFSGADAITALRGRRNDSDPVSSAVETTTVPALTTASDDAAESDRND